MNTFAVLQKEEKRKKKRKYIPYYKHSISTIKKRVSLMWSRAIAKYECNIFLVLIRDQKSFVVNNIKALWAYSKKSIRNWISGISLPFEPVRVFRQNEEKSHYFISLQIFFCWTCYIPDQYQASTLSVFKNCTSVINYSFPSLPRRFFSQCYPF